MPAVASLEELRELGGMKQWVSIRGVDTAKLILLWLHGGPGAAQTAMARRFNCLRDHDDGIHLHQEVGRHASNPPLAAFKILANV